MISAIKHTILKILNMLNLFIDSGEDLAYASKALTTYSRQGCEAFSKEAQLERAKSYKDLQAKLEEAGIE